MSVTHHWPYVGWYQNFKQVVNEVSALIQTYGLFYFSDFASNRTNAGYILIIISILTILFNLAPQLWQVFRAVYYKLRRKYYHLLYKVRAARRARLLAQR